MKIKIHSENITSGAVTKPVAAAVKYYQRAFGAIPYWCSCTNITESVLVWPRYPTLPESPANTMFWQNTWGNSHLFSSRITGRADKVHKENHRRRNQRNKSWSSSTSTLKFCFRALQWHIHTKHDHAFRVLSKTAAKLLQTPDGRAQHFVVA